MWERIRDCGSCCRDVCPGNVFSDGEERSCFRRLFGECFMWHWSKGGVDRLMVSISHGSLTSPLLGDRNEITQNSCSTGLHRNEVVVDVPSESQDGVIPDESPANQSRNTFQQIHALNRTRFNYHSRSKSRRRGHSIRNAVQKDSSVARANIYSAKTDTWRFLYNLMIGLFMWPKWSWDAIKKNSSLSILAAKQALCAGLCSIPCVVTLPKPFTEVSAIALWAVVTTGVLFEENIGLSISKGCNRVLGTLASGCLGFSLNQLGLQLGPVYHPYFVVFCVVMSAFIFRFLKGIPRLKPQWSYAFTVATIAFHIFIICGHLFPERWTLPMLRFSMILVGCALTSIVNVAFRPIYAGDTLHKLVAKNFETAANALERCVEEFIKDAEPDHAPDILSGQCEDDKNHQSYHKRVVPDSDIEKLVSVVELLRQLVMPDTDVEKLLSAVFWEPPHGKFFRGYPWHLYDDIAASLRFTLYDAIAFDLCLRANIQAPRHIRDILAQEMSAIATECAAILRILGDSVKNMKKFSSKNLMARAEEAAAELQSKIHVSLETLLGSTTDEPEHLLQGTPWSSPPSIPQPRSDQDHFISANEVGMSKSWGSQFSHRKPSSGPHGASTLERISAQSLVKFASLLIEVVSKMRVVVDCVEDFSEQAQFQACSN